MCHKSKSVNQHALNRLNINFLINYYSSSLSKLTTQGLALEMLVRVEVVPSGCTPTQYVCGIEHSPMYLKTPHKMREKRGGIGKRSHGRHLVREPPLTWMK